MNNLAISVIRTWVPIIVGVILTFAAKAGFNIDSEALTIVITGIITGMYYLVVRFAETHFGSSWGWLLGKASRPAYLRIPENNR